MSISNIPFKVGKTLSASLLAATVTVTAFEANGALLPRDFDGDGVPDAYYDTAQNITWLRDWGASGQLTWAQAVVWATSLNVGGVAGWRLPNITDTGNAGCDFSTAGGTDCGYNVDTKTSELARLWYVTLGNLSFCAVGDANCNLQGAGQPGWGLTNTGPFRNVQAAAYWFGAAYAPDTAAAWNFSTNDGSQDFDSKTELFYAVAVHAGDVAPAPVGYRVTDLTPSGFTASAIGVGDEQQVGVANAHAFLWSNDVDSGIDLNPVGFAQSSANAVADGRQAGEAVTQGGVHRAMLWKGTAGSAVDLTPAGFAQATAFGMDDVHQVGRGQAGGNTSKALLWSGSAGSAVNLHPPGFTTSEAWGVGDGQQAGFGQSAVDGHTHALFWTGTAVSVVDLHPAGFTDSRATAVAGGRQAGVGFDPGGLPHALLWSGSAATVVDLSPPGFTSSQINAMAGGQQAGWGSTSSDAGIHALSTNGQTQALVWTSSAGSAIDLNDFLPSDFFQASAQGIDDAGNIVGSGTNSPVTFAQHAFLWTPVLPFGLDVTNVGTPDHIHVGDKLTYTVTVTNSRSGTARGVVVTDAIAVGTLVSATPSQGSCIGTSVIQCGLGSLPGNSSATVTIVVQTPQGFFGEFVDNTASVEADDLLTTSNSEVTPVQFSADLAITNSDVPDPAFVGKNLTYTIKVSNPGVFAATNVTVQDTLPAGVSFVSATANQGSCSGSATVVCNLGSLLVGTSGKVTIIVKPSQTGSISNTATVSADQFDPDMSNNSATQNTTVNAAPLPDLTGTWTSVAQKCVNKRGKATCTLTGSIDIANQGTATSKATVVRWYLSDDANFSPDDVKLGQAKLSSLGAGQHKAVKLKASVAAGGNASGKFLIAVIDPTALVTESDKSNNNVATAAFP